MTINKFEQVFERVKNGAVEVLFALETGKRYYVVGVALKQDYTGNLAEYLVCLNDWNERKYYFSYNEVENFIC